MADISLEKRLELAASMLKAGFDLDVWIMDENGNIVQQTGRDLVLQTVITNFGLLKDLLEMAAKGIMQPVCCSLDNLIFGAVFEYEKGQPKRINLLGPAYIGQFCEKYAEKRLDDQNILIAHKSVVLKSLRSIPVISNPVFVSCLMSFYYAVTEKRCTAADIYYDQKSPVTDPFAEEGSSKDRYQTYLVDRALYLAVKNGDPDYKEILSKARRLSNGIDARFLNDLQKVQFSAHALIDKCMRAAIEGGLSPEKAYSRGDWYLQQVLDCQNVMDIAGINHRMMEDFVQSVRKVKNQSVDSSVIQSVCDYIEANVESPLNMEILAARAGYSPNYLSHKFRKEMAMSVREYITKARMNRCKFLLETTDLSIADIADRLHYSSRNYLTTVFEQQTGMSPVEYRKRYKAK